jgi:hypothetical protein
MRAAELIEQVIGAFRARDVDGRIQASPAWHDLAADEREAAFEATVQQRQLEAALDPEGLSSTARAVLARITGG